LKWVKWVKWVKWMKSRQKLRGHPSDRAPASGSLAEVLKRLDGLGGLPFGPGGGGRLGLGGDLFGPVTVLAGRAHLEARLGGAPDVLKLVEGEFFFGAHIGVVLPGDVALGSHVLSLAAPKA